MLVALLKSKIHKASITSTELEYVGSIAICPKLLKEANFFPGEKVHVLNFNNGNRFETYTIEGKEGEIGLRGPAAKLGSVGDKVIILSYGFFTTEEAKSFKGTALFVDEKNNIVKKKNV
jgi:aspartate 1-decarboxylase